MNKISIIVPIYNSEKTLSKCIDSILNQSYENIELILINDGSTDCSKDICEDYSRKDSRIMLIDKPNRGVSATRNEGIRRATGEYITFVDSDDWIEPKMYERMILEIEKQKVDFALCGSFWHFNSEVKPFANTDKVINRNRDYFIDRIYVEEDISFNLWNTVVKRKLVDKLFMKENIWISEDNVYILEMLLRANNGVIMDECYYHYVQYENSLINSKMFSYETFSKIYANELQAQLLKEYSKNYYKEYKHTLLRDYINTCRRMATSNCKEKKYIRIIKSRIRKSLLRGDAFSKGTVKKTVLNGVIISISYNLFRIIYRKKNSN